MQCYSSCPRRPDIHDVYLIVTSDVISISKLTSETERSKRSIISLNLHGYAKPLIKSNAKTSYDSCHRAVGAIKTLWNSEIVCQNRYIYRIHCDLHAHIVCHVATAVRLQLYVDVLIFPVMKNRRFSYCIVVYIKTLICLESHNTRSHICKGLILLQVLQPKKQFWLNDGNYKFARPMPIHDQTLYS